MLWASPRQETLYPIFTYIIGYGWKITFSPLQTFPPMGNGVQSAVVRGPPFSVSWSPSPGAMSTFIWLVIWGRITYEKVQLKSLLFPWERAACREHSDAVRASAWRSPTPSSTLHLDFISNEDQRSYFISQTSKNPGNRKGRRMAFTLFPQIFQHVHEPEPKPLPHGPEAPT